MWGMGLMFWWGGWLLYNFPDQYTFRNFLIAMFSIFFCFYALMVASGGAVDKEKAKRAAERIFELTDRKSLIDPLLDENRFTEI
jgi:ATP-binding cassette subfamily B (MDR/TAP) protein 1